MQAGMQAGQQNLGQHGSGFGAGAAWNQGPWNGWAQTQPNTFGQNGFGGGVGSPLHTLFGCGVGGGVGEGASRDAA
jgi:hypothetical protein